MMDGWDALPWVMVGITLVIVGVVVGGVWIIVVALRSTRPQPPEPQTFLAPATRSHAAAPSTSVASGSGLTPEVVAEIDRLVAAERKIQAIKVYRDRTGTSLSEAKDRIDHWSVSTTGVPASRVSHATPAHSSVTPAAATPSTVRASLPPAAAAEIDRLVASGSAIAAIKVLRQHSGLGLKESKDLIQAWPHSHLS